MLHEPLLAFGLWVNTTFYKYLLHNSKQIILRLSHVLYKVCAWSSFGWWSSFTKWFRFKNILVWHGNYTFLIKRMKCSFRTKLNKSWLRFVLLKIYNLIFYFFLFFLFNILINILQNILDYFLNLNQLRQMILTIDYFFILFIVNKFVILLMI